MAQNLTPTKSNLINARNSLKMASQGYDMLDLKRRLLMRELAKYTDEEKRLQEELRDTLAAATDALREANVRMGLERVGALAASIPEINDIDIIFYSVMGVEIPVVRTQSRPERKPHMSLYKTDLSLDEAAFRFSKVTELCMRCAEVHSAAERLNRSIRKTQTRANALKNIMIPRYTRIIAEISDAIEEKERGEFSRLKAIKKIVENKS